MKITVFDGGAGDSVLVNSTKGRNVLFDGGKTGAYRANIAPTLDQLRSNGDALDLVCVSHIDADHIEGVLAMLDAEFKWRVYDYQTTQGLSPRKPRVKRPPKIDEIWHNAFHEQLNRNKGQVADMLAAARPASLALGGGPTTHGGDIFSRLATSERQAALVSRRIGDKQLGVPLNKAFGGKLVARNGTPKTVKIGDMKITVLGPTTARLKELRDEWNKWLRSTKGKDQLAKIRRQASADERALSNGDMQAFFNSLNLGPAVGNRDSVSESNISSIVCLIEEKGRTLLMTGDARDDHVYEDLVAAGLTDGQGRLHVDVLKIPHHGSENNYSLDFGQKVIADHYVFCGNGSHHNPDVEVINQLLDSRIGTPAQQSKHPKVCDRFKLWFSADSKAKYAKKDHMKDLEQLVAKRCRASGKAFDYHFSPDESFDISL